METEQQQTGLDWFRAAVPYVAAHRDRTMVIAIAGEAAQAPAFPTLLRDIAQLRALGTRVVLVHGARPQIEVRLRERGLAPRYAAGLRVTDADALEAVCDAVGRLRLHIEGLLSRNLGSPGIAGARLRVASGNFVTARPLGVREGVDFQYTGEVRRVDAQGIARLLDEGQIVLVSPLGYSPTGEVFNLSGEDVATQVAAALKADKLVFLTEAGPLRDRQREMLTQLTVPAAEQLLATDSRLPEELAAHLRSAIEVCTVHDLRVHLVDRHIDGGLLIELFSRRGIGTLVSREPVERLRAATVDDVGGIFDLIQPLESEGILVRRSREHLELEIDCFQVLDADGLIIGTAALYTFPETQAAEIACLALHPEYRGGGRGDQILEHIETLARRRGHRQVFVLTTRTAQWFQERGYREGQVTELPPSRQALYNQARNSKVLVKPLG
ncbi:N-acetylglutamate synthase [Thioalkalivibrio nitratireducens DSM 14787]|uniref:Amino-acid acetyltransferase n=1 Tax=Thioalkalivibrio nitratireducens (strain DSM 14787 / UNIQEM 213 / ALEN2) TaxID=1255043 RepID=L0DUW0_THIND|nr:amino-acid N-acetyltransferase [Thioalkalivibrio nitratireducens]AGA32151.1 N-acetylglutamate synthase [Thioalkalivibrio nitratireducens DSM 14787]